MSRKQILPAPLRDLSVWPIVAPALIDEKWRAEFRRREQAIRKYLQGESIKRIERESGIDRRQLYHLLERCTAKHSDGRIYGFRGLLPYVRVRGYARLKPVKASTTKRPSGAAGAMTLLLDRHPPLRALLERAIAEHDVWLNEQGRLQGLERLHVRWIEHCRALHIGTQEYPLNQSLRGIRSLSGAVKQMLARSFAQAARASGAERVPGLWLDSAPATPPARRPFEVVEFDGHKLDLPLRVRLQDPYGLTYDIEVERPWLLVILEVCTRAVLGWHLVIASEYNRHDVIKTVQNALQPRRGPSRRGKPIHRSARGDGRKWDADLTLVALPGVLYEGNEFSGRSYCFLPRWRSPAESAWSLISKFQLLNRITSSELIACLSATRARYLPDQLDLRASEHFSPSAMITHFELTPSELEEAFAMQHSNDVLSEAYSPHLRFCPICMAQGFHATVFQFRPLRRCPIHGTRLLSRCPQCRRLIAYRVDSALARRPYYCPHCRHCLAPPLDAPHGSPRRFHPTEIAPLHAWCRCIDTYAADIACGRLTLRDMTTGQFLSRQAMRRHFRIMERLRFLGDLQTLFHTPPPLIQQHPPKRREVIKGAWPGPGRTPSLRKGLLEEWPDFGNGFRTFQSVYFGCREQLGVQALIANTGRLALQTDHPQPLKIIKARRLRPEGFAVLLWRMAWEGHRDPRLLDDYFAPPLGLATWLAFAPLPSPTLPDAKHRTWLRSRLISHCSALLSHTRRLAG